jgi:hypothetical protein
MNLKEIETAAAVCQNAQTVIDECTNVLKQLEDNATVRIRTCGMISAAVEALILAQANLRFCTNILYKPIDNQSE